MNKGLLILAVFGTALLSGQEGGPPPGPPPHGFVGAPGRFGMGIGMHPGRVVTGAPYSADATTSVSQTLSDGNTINRVTTGHMARDKQGRTYSEQDLSGGPWSQNGGGTKIIFLSDPVAGYTYVLNPVTKVAMRRALKPPPDGDRPPRLRPEGPRTGPGGRERVEADLGTQVINGVNASGKSITHSIPAGAIGNAQPIVEKSEVWTAADLQVVVLSKRSDPRMGVSTYALTNIQRADPNPALFQVPSDYTIQDAPGPHGRGNRPGPPQE